MIPAVIHFFWPDLKEDEQKKFSLLSFTALFIMGTFWLMRMIKNTVFYRIAFPESMGWLAGQGRLLQPTAKLASLFVVVILILIYTRLVDLIEKHTLFYVVCSFFALIFGSLATLLAIRDFGGDIVLGKNVLAAIGWITYFAIESFGSIIVTLFWSFTASVTDSKEAERCYPMIVTAAQLGAILGSSITFFAERFGGIWQLFLLASISTASIMLIIRHFMKVIPSKQQVGNQLSAKTEHREESFSESLTIGLRLLFTRPYVIGILIVSTTYEAIGQIVEYQMQSQAELLPQYSGEIGFAKFQGLYGICANSLSFFIALFLTGYLIRRFGITFCLMLYPLCLGIAIAGLFALFNFANPTPETLLWTTFVILMITKGLSFAINNPAIEILYIPTSKDIKFKSKGWIDVPSSRAVKVGGSSITSLFKHNFNDLMMYGSLCSLGLTSIWLLAAWKTGKKNQDLRTNNLIVE